jgi:capsular polysaccharide biosynthesis protein
MDGHMLDYPYLLMRTRQNSRYLVSTRNESKSIKRGIDLLCYTSGYYHWLLEGVPRILDLIDDGIDFDHYPLVLPPLEPYQRELLQVFGISPDSQVVTVGKNDWCHVEDCIFPTAYFPFAAPELDDPSGQPDGSLLRRIRDRVMERLPRLPVDSTYSPKRIYISRAKARWRRLTDQSEGDVRSVLEARGFETVFLEDMAWTEQVLLLSGAEFIAGLHGAGLANILFAKAGTLLELHNPLEARSYFALMARELNMRYAYIIGTLGGCSKKFNNIVVDCQDLERIVNQLDGAS